MVPATFALQYLKRRSNAIWGDPMLELTPFIIANQVGLWISIWCRFLEVAHGFRDEMGHATFGFGQHFSHVGPERRLDYRSYGGGPDGRRSAFVSARHRRNQRDEDEIELAACSFQRNDTNVESGATLHGHCSENGIFQQSSFGVEADNSPVE